MVKRKSMLSARNARKASSHKKDISAETLMTMMILVLVVSVLSATMYVYHDGSI